jgi:general secretion pathway protein H
MPKWAIGMPNKGQSTVYYSNKGFTLIEILVVILIVGISASIAVLAFGDFGSGRKAEVAAEQFQSYVKMVQQRAILETNTLGININQNSYQTYRFQNLKWQPMPKKSIFHSQKFPNKVIVTLQSSIKNQTFEPDIVINPSGDMTPFRLYFGNAANPKIITLIGQHDGDLILKKERS